MGSFRLFSKADSTISGQLLKLPPALAGGSLRMAFRSDMKVLKQKTGDYRHQENICLECYSKELSSLSEDCQSRMEIKISLIEHCGEKGGRLLP